MQIRILLMSLMLSQSVYLQAQLIKTNEKITEKKYSKYSIMSLDNGGINMIRRVERRLNYFEGIKVSYKDGAKLSEVNLKPPFERSDISGQGYLRIIDFSNEVWVYSILYSDDETYEIYYQNLWLQYKGKDYLLDSIYNADKLIHSSFNSDGRYLLVNTLNTLSDYYNPDQDNRIMVYDLSQLDEGIIDKQYIPCPQCADSYLVGDSLFFTIGRKDGYDGWSNKDIYVAPWGSLQDSVKIASTTNLKGVSPDGKYILGSRFFDLQQPTAVMIDVDSKKYQLLLGRNYAEKRAFYSFEEEKFVFDFREHFIYVDYPKTYPFDALKWRNEEIPDWTHEEFWKRYVHDTLSNEN